MTELSPGEISRLQSLSARVREHIIRMATNGGCFIGASLSCADILVYLYEHFLNVTRDNLSDPKRDYFFLSKGHDVPALYGLFAEKGFIGKERLGNHLKTTDSIYWHPNTAVPGVEFHSGSLGHLLSVAAGVAYDCIASGTRNKVAVMLGDGEMNEGSVWEAMLTCAALKLHNLTAIIDRNKFQANFLTEELIPLEPLKQKIESFGWHCIECSGHDFSAMHAAFHNAGPSGTQPVMVICDTVRGKGLPSIEARADRWFCNFSAEEIEQLLLELRTGAPTELTSKTIVAR